MSFSITKTDISKAQYILEVHQALETVFNSDSEEGQLEIAEQLDQLKLPLTRLIEKVKFAYSKEKPELDEITPEELDFLSMTLDDASAISKRMKGRVSIIEARIGIDKIMGEIFHEINNLEFQPDKLEEVEARLYSLKDVDALTPEVLDDIKRAEAKLRVYKELRGTTEHKERKAEVKKPSPAITKDTVTKSEWDVSEYQPNPWGSSPITPSILQAPNPSSSKDLAIRTVDIFDIRVNELVLIGSSRNIAAWEQLISRPSDFLIPIQDFDQVADVYRRFLTTTEHHGHSGIVQQILDKAETMMEALILAQMEWENENPECTPRFFVAKLQSLLEQAIEQLKSSPGSILAVESEMSRAYCLNFRTKRKLAIALEKTFEKAGKKAKVQFDVNIPFHEWPGSLFHKLEAVKTVLQREDLSASDLKLSDEMHQTFFELKFERANKYFV